MTYELPNIPEPARSDDISAVWDTAMAVDDYAQGLWRKQRARYRRNRERTAIEESVHAGLGPGPLNVLVITEPWCEDSAQLVPMLWRLADERPGTDVRVVREHEHRELAGRYLNAAGHPAIPVFIVLDEDGREVGALVERPARVTTEMLAELRRFQVEHPELEGIARTLERMPEETRAAVKDHLSTWRDEQHERWVAYLIESLSAIVRDAAVRRSGS